MLMVEKARLSPAKKRRVINKLSTISGKILQQ
jgi:hypothetical protein